MSSLARHNSADFTCFPELPVEIRIKIWKFSFRPRLVTVTPSIDRPKSICHTVVETQPVELLHVCQESRAEAEKEYSRIMFNGNMGPVTHFSCSRDTLFLDLPDSSLDVNQIMERLGPAFQGVQTIAVRVKSHIIWAFASFLRSASHIRRLIFVEDTAEMALEPEIKIFFYLADLGMMGLVRGSYIDTFGKASLLEGENLINLKECESNEFFDTKQWELSHDLIKMVVDLDNNAQEYILLL